MATRELCNLVDGRVIPVYIYELHPVHLIEAGTNAPNNAITNRPRSASLSGILIAHLLSPAAIHHGLACEFQTS